MKKKIDPINSFSNNSIFSLGYAIRSIKELRKSELCKANKHEWYFILEKGFYSQDHYKCKQCGEKRIQKPR